MRFLLFIVLFLFAFNSIHAGVNLKNGGFYISYTDIIVQGKNNNLKIQRTYNSKSSGVGWFGFGWGSLFETHLKVSVDGSVVVHENGLGAKTRFTPKKSVDSTAAAKRIISAMKQKQKISESVEKKLINKLKNSAELRQSYSNKYGIKTELAKGTVLYSTVRGPQRVVKTSKGYQRVHDSGKKEYFNKDGKLIKISHSNKKYHINIVYKKGKVVPAYIKDSDGRQIAFTWTAVENHKVVKSLKSVGGKSIAGYKYDGKNLKWAKNVANVVYDYIYDQNHNMKEIVYSKSADPKTNRSTKIIYNKAGFVNKIVGKDNNVSIYKYSSDKKNPDLAFSTTVEKWTPKSSKFNYKTLAGYKKKLTSKYEYEMKIKPDGSRYTYKIATTINGVRKETIYSECCSLPLKISEGKKVTTFEYDGKGRLLKKSSTSGKFLELQYHKKFNRITRVVNKAGWTKFFYEEKSNGDGRLSKAVNSKGDNMVFVYDRKDRIRKMVYKSKNKSPKNQSFSFKYNDLNKPVEISMKGVAKVNVAYDDNGQIKRVNSKSDSESISKLWKEFRHLLAIVSPSGLSLGI